MHLETNEVEIVSQFRTTELAQEAPILHKDCFLVILFVTP